MPSFSTNYFFDDSTHSSVSMKRPNGANERRIYFKHSLQWRTAQPSPTRNRIISDIFGCDSSFCAKRLSENGLEWGAGKECWHRLTDKMNNPVNVRWQKIVTEFSSFHHQHISRRNRLNPFVCNLVEKRFIRNFNWKHLSAQITARSTEVFVTNKWNILLDFYGNVARWIWCAYPKAKRSTIGAEPFQKDPEPATTRENEANTQLDSLLFIILSNTIYFSAADGLDRAWALGWARCEQGKAREP